jgi:hypothetical protein
MRSGLVREQVTGLRLSRTSGARRRIGRPSKAVCASISVLALALTVSCTSGSVPESDIRPGNIAETWSENPSCVIEATGASSPESAERTLYYSRINKNGFITPINLSCIYNTYDREALKYWSARGDVVARLALTVERLNREDTSCANWTAELPTLEAIGQAMIEEPGPSSGKLFRAPEALLVASEVQRLCGRAEEASTYTEMATTNRALAPTFSE